MIIEYVEGWLNGRGAKGIDSLEGKPGVHPALMEDLATGRMSVAQIAQRIRHATRTTEGPAASHDFALVKRLLQEELDDILSKRPADAAVQTRLPEGAEDLAALDQELHGPRFPEPGELHTAGARRDRGGERCVLKVGGPIWPPTPEASVTLRLRRSVFDGAEAAARRPDR